MANNWRYYAGTTSSGTVIKDLARVFCTAVQTNSVKDGAGNVIKEKEIIIKNNWDIAFPKPDKDSAELRNVMDWNNLSSKEFKAKIENQILRAGDTIILKTKTSKKDLSALDGSDDLGLENDLGVDSVEMYVELYKPTYLADPEKYTPECERLGVTPSCITQDIYREFSNSLGYSEIDLKQACAGQPCFSTSKVSDPKNGTKTYSCFDDVNAALVNFNNDLNDNFKFVNNHYAENITINLDADYMDKLKGTPSEKFISDITGILRTKVCGYKGSIQFYYYIGGGNYYVSISLNKSLETYTFTEGFKFKLPELDKVKSDTVKFKLSEIGDPGSWEYDKVTCEFKILKVISGVVDKVGSPILSYNYEKEQVAITGRKLLYNNHYIYVRMFDKIKDDMSGPLADVIDDKTGEAVQINSHVSEWSKLSWYQDFEEVLIDQLDSDICTSDISNGMVFLPVETPGLNSDTRIKFWTNCNNDRVSLIMMGNPSLDFGKNRHLISASYIGQIESFADSINDTAGNFALFTSSSTIPCSSKTNTRRVIMNSSKLVGIGDGTVKVFTLKADTDQFFDTTGNCSVTFEKDGISTTVKNGEAFSYEISSDKKTLTVTTFTSPTLGNSVTVNYSYYTSKVEMIEGVKRDGFGNVLNVVYPNSYGKNSGTGVIDVSMFHTRSKAYYQKHHMMFTATEEYMTKQMYGKSAYTGEYYADKIKITHGNDGPRGMLSDVLSIDTSSLVCFDELIVNRDFEKDANKAEETYIYFPITAPYSPMAGSTNSTHGFAIKTKVRLPHPVTDNEFLDRAEEELRLMVGDLHNLVSDITLPTESGEVTGITWSSNKESLITIV